MSDWEVELCNHYHQTLVDSIARRQDATAKAEAMLAEVEREIQRHEAYIAYELNATAIGMYLHTHKIATYSRLGSRRRTTPAGT